MEATLSIEGRWGLNADGEMSLELPSATSAGNPFPFLKAWYLTLHQKYFREAEEFFEKGDLVQASEKYWGACAELIKAIAAEEGVELRSHGLIEDYVEEKLAGKDPELDDLFDSAARLHINFYEGRLRRRGVERKAERVKKFIWKCKSYWLSAPQGIY